MSTAGNLWMAACERYLAPIWPGVGRQRKPHSNDLTGTWDLGIEATIVPWSKVWIKLGQAERDAKGRGLEWSCVWKKHNRAPGDRGSVDAGEGAVIMYARQFFPMVARLERLERLELEVSEAYDRGYRNGQLAARNAEAIRQATARQEAV